MHREWRSMRGAQGWLTSIVPARSRTVLSASMVFHRFSNCTSISFSALSWWITRDTPASKCVTAGFLPAVAVAEGVAHKVCRFGLLLARSGSLEPNKVSRRVELEHLWTPLVIGSNEDHCYSDVSDVRDAWSNVGPRRNAGRIAPSWANQP
jgi:hypothetical protein